MGISNWLAVVVSALAVFTIGWLWYGPLFSKPWASGMGFSNSGSDATVPPPTMLFLSYLMSFFLATALASILGTAGITEIGAALQAAFMLWLGIVATTYTLNQIYDNRPWRVWAINIGYHLVGMLVMALILTLWP